MTDRYENIRKALAMGPTPGPWEFNKNPKEGECPLVYGPNQTPLMDHISDEAPPDYFERWVVRDADAAYIAACDPDTIRALLAERDALAAALEAALVDAERYRKLRAMATQQADYLGPIFRIDVRRSEPYLFNFDAAIDAAMSKEDKQ